MSEAVDLAGEPMSDTEWNRLLSSFLGEMERCIESVSKIEEMRAAFIKEISDTVKRFNETLKVTSKNLKSAEREIVEAINKVYKRGPSNVNAGDWDSLNGMHNSLMTIQDESGLWNGKLDLGEVMRGVKRELDTLSPEVAQKEIDYIVSIYRERDSDGGDADWAPATKYS